MTTYFLADSGKLRATDGPIKCDEIILQHVTKLSRPQVTHFFPEFWRDRKAHLLPVLQELRRLSTIQEQEAFMRATRMVFEKRIRALFGERHLYFHFLYASPEQIREAGGVLSTTCPGDAAKVPVLYYFDGAQFSLTDLISHQVSRGRPVLVVVDANNEYFRRARIPLSGRQTPLEFNQEWLDQNPTFSGARKEHRDFQGRYLAIPYGYILGLPVDYQQVEFPSDTEEELFQSNKYNNELLQISYVEYVLSRTEI